MAPQRKGLNSYIVVDDYAVLFFKNKNNEIFEITIDLNDIEKLIDFGYSWHTSYSWTTGHYVRTHYFVGVVDGKKKYKSLYLHRFLMDAIDGEYVDHINQDTMDNRKSNLRKTTNSNNLKHRKGANKNNKTGCRNVAYSTTSDTYLVQFQVDGKRTRFGEFKVFEEARDYANYKRLELYGEYSGKHDPKIPTKV